MQGPHSVRNLVQAKLTTLPFFILRQQSYKLKYVINVVYKPYIQFHRDFFPY